MAPSKSDSAVSEEFKAYYLQRATKELAEDLDKVRGADDFKNDAIPLLIHALQQGAGMFSAEDKRAIVSGAKEQAQEEGN
jgi:ribosome assembly protein 3